MQLTDSVIQTILDAVCAARKRRSGPLLIALDGPCGAGKSTAAAAVATAIPAVIVPSDDFFAADITSAEWDARSAPERARDAIDWRRLRRDALEPLRAGQPAAWQPFDFESGERPDGTYGMSATLVRREPAPLIIVEGAYSTRPELADLIDLSLLIDAPADVRERRLAAREAAAFLLAWHARWDGAEAFYFAHVRPGSAFDLIVSTSDLLPRSSGREIEHR